MFKLKFPDGKWEIIEDPGEQIFGYNDDVELNGNPKLSRDNTEFESSHPEVHQLFDEYANGWDYEKRGYASLLFHLVCVDSYLEQVVDDEDIRPLLENHINIIKHG